MNRIANLIRCMLAVALVFAGFGMALGHVEVRAQATAHAAAAQIRAAQIPAAQGPEQVHAAHPHIAQVAAQAESAAIGRHCHDAGSAGGSAAALDDLACSLLCCAIAPPTVGVAPAPVTTHIARLSAPETARDVSRAPPAPPPRA